MATETANLDVVGEAVIRFGSMLEAVVRWDDGDGEPEIMTYLYECPRTPDLEPVAAFNCEEWDEFVKRIERARWSLYGGL